MTDSGDVGPSYGASEAPATRITSTAFPGGSEMAMRCGAFEWSTTPLGPVSSWPAALRIAAGLVLGAGFPMILLWGPELIQLYNDGYVPFLAHKHPDGLGRATRDVWPEVWHINEPIYARVLSGETVALEEARFPVRRRGNDGPEEQLSVTLAYSPVPDDSGGVGGVLVTLRDMTAEITGRVAEAERARLAAELATERINLLQEIFRQSPSFLHVLRGPDFVFELANEGYYQLVGHRDLIGRPAFEALPEARGGGFEERLAHVRATGEPFVGRELPVTLARTPGATPEERLIDLVYLPLADAEGLYTRVLGHGFDVTEHVQARRQADTERARAEAAQRESEARAHARAAELHAVLESMSDAVYIGGVEGITLANRAALEQLGYATREELNRHIGTLAAEIDTRDAETGEPISVERQAFARALAGERVVQDVRVRHRVSGEARVVRSAASPVLVEGRVTSAVAVNTDVTERRRVEAALRAREARQAFLVRLGDALRPLTEMADIEGAVCRLIAEELRADRAVYAQIVTDGEVECFDLARNYCAPGVQPMLGRHPIAAFGVEPIEALRAGRVATMSATTAHAEFSDETRAAYAAVGVAAFIAVPLVRGGVFVAVFGVHQNEARDWRPDEIALVEEAAHRAWSAVEYARADGSLRAREARQAFLVQLGDALRPLGDPVAVQSTAARLLGEHLGANQVHYGEVTGDAVVIRQGYGSGLPPMAGTFHHAREGWGARLLESYRAGRTAVCDDVTADPTITPAEAAVIAGAGFRAYVAVPLLKEGVYVAVLAVHSIAPKAWRAEDVALVEEVAERTWSAVERARAEAALRESEARYRMLVENVRDYAIFGLDADGVVTDWTAGAARVKGYAAEEVVGRHISLFYTPEAIADGEPARELREAAETGRVERESWRVRKGGESFWANEIATAIRDGEGRLVGFTKISRDLSERRLVAAAAEQASLAGARDDLRRQLAAVEEAERRRLARELHDQLGQELTAFRLGLDEAARLAATHDGARARSDAPLLHRLAGLQTLARRMTVGARYLALELRPPELDDLGLESALATFAAEWSARYGVAADVAVTGGAERAIPAEVSSTLYRIAQEALTNVAKHAGARAVSVIVEKPDGEVRLIVEDDGRGFDPDATAVREQHERRLGLAGMRERAALVGGTVAIESSPGGGTTLYVRLPLASIPAETVRDGESPDGRDSA